MNYIVQIAESVTLAMKRKLKPIKPCMETKRISLIGETCCTGFFEQIDKNN